MRTAYLEAEIHLSITVPIKRPDLKMEKEIESLTEDLTMRARENVKLKRRVQKVEANMERLESIHEQIQQLRKEFKEQGKRADKLHERVAGQILTIPQYARILLDDR